MYMGDGISDLQSPYMNVSRPPWTGPDVISAGCQVFSWVFSWGDVFSAVSGVAGIDVILAVSLKFWIFMPYFTFWLGINSVNSSKAD